MMSEWQPIETAPKDGTAILGINDEWFGDGAPKRCRFIDGEWVLDPPIMTLGRVRRIPDPTHWKPTGTHMPPIERADQYIPDNLAIVIEE